MTEHPGEQGRVTRRSLSLVPAGPPLRGPPLTFMGFRNPGVGAWSHVDAAATLTTGRANASHRNAKLIVRMRPGANAMRKSRSPARLLSGPSGPVSRLARNPNPGCCGCGASGERDPSLRTASCSPVRGRSHVRPVFPHGREPCGKLEYQALVAFMGFRNPGVGAWSHVDAAATLTTGRANASHRNAKLIVRMRPGANAMRKSRSPARLLSGPSGPVSRLARNPNPGCCGCGASGERDPSLRTASCSPVRGRSHVRPVFPHGREPCGKLEYQALVAPQVTMAPWGTVPVVA